jgi:hypothetical protein
VIDAAEIIRSRTSILFVTLDSLRYDTARTAYDGGLTPHLASLLPDGGWERRQTPGTFTLPANIAFFSGFLPKLPQPEQPLGYGSAGRPRSRPSRRRPSSSTPPTS